MQLRRETTLRLRGQAIAGGRSVTLTGTGAGVATLDASGTVVWKGTDSINAISGAGSTQSMDYAAFLDHGYRGLYGGLNSQDLQRRKRVDPKEDILDRMDSTELAANLFRATQTEEKLRRENIRSKQAANQVHEAVGKKVRQTIQDLGGTMPEDLPAVEDIKKVERRQKNRLKGGQKPSLQNPPEPGS